MFYHEIRPILDKIIQYYGNIKYMQYSDFYELKEIGFGGYGTVYTAKYKRYSELRFKSFDAPELFISEVSNNWSY